MILIDTNIISELMKPNPFEKVIHWLDEQDNMQLFISAVTIAEINYGLSILPEGGRRKTLEQAFKYALEEAFNSRILSFDADAAYHYGEILGHQKLLGKPMGVPDGQIAAIARLHHASLATRNIRDFADCGLVLIDPFR